MRISARAKQQTRQRILARAHELFAARGFGRATTRDVAAAAGIATGTLFNYFASKEALGMQLLASALDSAAESWRRQRLASRDRSLEEDLFALIASLLRALEPHRGYVADVLQTAMSPFLAASSGTPGESFRVDHLETVRQVLIEHQADMPSDPAGTTEPSFVSMHLYWTLFLGVLSFWSGDTSPGQEDSLAVLDQSLGLFTASLRADPAPANGTP